jgi:hypothetical protein
MAAAAGVLGRRGSGANEGGARREGVYRWRWLRVCVWGWAEEIRAVHSEGAVGFGGE